MPTGERDVAALAEVGDGEMLAIDFEGQKVLLVRHGERIDAIGATCPHAGGPLDEGILHDGRVICPWHKAAFCIRTGALLEPPAVDSVPRYEARVESGRVLLSEPTAKRAEAPAAEDSRCFVIVGGGGAGAVAAQSLRELGFAARITILDRENRVPYDRTVLSKYDLSGEEGGEKSPLQTQAFYRDNRIERVTGEVVGIDPARREIRCADGASFRYDAALLASGARALRPGFLDPGLRNAFVLRSRADQQAILAQAERSRRVVILGTSFIGMEVAASLRERGLDVTVIGKEAEPFETTLGAEVGAALRSLHEARGVVFRLESTIEELIGDKEVRGVRLEGGAEVEADLVVAGFGVEPDLDYAAGLTLAPKGGLAVDGFLRVADGLYAAGDIATFPAWGEGPPIRVEHWRVAQQHGRVAALNMLGRPTRFEAPPVFWTIHYRKRLDYVGHAATWDTTMVHGDPAALDFLIYYVKDGTVAAAAGMGRDRDTAALTELFRIRRRWTVGELGSRPAETLKTVDA